MALVLKSLHGNYKNFFNDFQDPRIINLPLLNSPVPLFIICFVYLRFVLKDGPKFMENRKPLELEKFMIFYNLFQVVCNLALGSKGLYWWILYHKFKCQPVDFSNSPIGEMEVFLGFCYFCLKILDLLDTVFFVLRKKQSQVTFLHLYHHVTILLFTYVALKVVPGGHSSLLPIVNSFVHGIMYFYYFLTSINSEVKKSIWWKKYVTQMQLAQFVLLTIHFSWPLIIERNCDYPKIMLLCGVVQNLFMLILFSDFYRRSYLGRE